MATGYLRKEKTHEKQAIDDETSAEKSAIKNQKNATVLATHCAIIFGYSSRIYIILVTQLEYIAIILAIFLVTHLEYILFV